MFWFTYAVYFFLVLSHRLFKPTTFLELVFQPAKISLWVRNRGDAIMRSKEYDDM
jgi:hypothetical protein